MKETTYLLVDNIIAAQTPLIEKPFKKILQYFNQIIEIGYHRGAFSLWLHRNKLKNTELYCYDINDGAREIFNEEIKFIVGNCFEEKIIEEIKSIINKNGKTLVLCDGGAKNSEFCYYSQFLKKGDVIMCHDYAHSDEESILIREKLNWYSGYESHYENIKDSVYKENLEPYNYDEFKNCLWGSFIKK